MAERYAVCRNIECRERNTYLPIKHGKTATCYACNEVMVIMGREWVDAMVNDLMTPVFEVDGVVFEVDSERFYLEQARSELRSLRSWGDSMTLSRSSIDVLMTLVNERLAKEEDS